MPSNPSIYAQRLFIGFKYNIATSFDEIGITKTYMRVKVEVCVSLILGPGGVHLITRLQAQATYFPETAP